ncbi:hypothetical protein AAZV13_11G060900 [Glycine max]
MSSPHNSSPDDSSPDNATPDNSTPDDSDNSSPPSQSPPPSSPPPSSPPPSSPPPSSPPPSSPPPSSPPPSSPPPLSPPPSSSSSPPPSPSPPTSNSPSPPSPNGSSQSPSPPGSSHSPPSFESPSPPHKSLDSPPSSRNSGSGSGSSNGGGNDSGGDGSSKAIVGAVLGVGSVLLILVIVCVVCNRKKKKKNTNTWNHNNYYNSGQHPSYYGGPHGDHVVRMQQNGMGPGGGGGWGAPPPPPMMMNSADFSSNYSTGPPPLPPPSPTLALGLKGGTFSYEELAAATNGFNDANLIGQGGFGYVHKGVLPSGKEVAVKSLKAGSGQGEREFQAEIDIISRVHHRHLVSLVGYSISGGQRMLVYEFIPNNTLEYHLHGKGRPTMDWATRMRIAIGSAKGLAYLHEDCHPRIIHRDIKAANVLIDDSFEAKVADFGLAKLTTDNNTHVSTRVMGTFGYLAPEYASSGKLTEKSDVFSFGVMLLELITGKRPVDHTNAMDDSLVDWVGIMFIFKSINLSYNIFFFSPLTQTFVNL